MVTNTGKVLNTAATNENNAVFLKVMTNAGDISGNFDSVCETNSCDLTKSGVRLFRCCGLNCVANATLLRRVMIGHDVLL